MAAVGEFGADGNNDESNKLEQPDIVDPRFEMLEFTVDDLAYLAFTEGKPYSEILQNYSNASRIYYDTVAEGIKNGNVEVITFKGEEGKRLSDAADIMVDLVREMPKYMHKLGIDDEEAMRVFVELMMADDQRRTQTYQALVSDPSIRFTKLDIEFAMKYVEGAYETELEGSDEEIYAERGIALLTVWGQLLSADMTKLGRSLIDDRRQARMDAAVAKILGEDGESIVKKTGRHVLEVGKIALGVAAGVVISKAIGKRF